MSTDIIPKYLLIVLLIFLFEVLSISKNKTCAQEENNTLNGQLLLDSSETYWYTFPDSAIYLSEKAINCFDTTKHKEMLSRAYSSFGTSYYIKGDYGKSLAYYFKALNINTVLSDSIGIAITLNNIGNIYMVEGKLTEANELFLSALDIKNKLKDNKSIGHTLLSISNLYYLEANYEDALDYALIALEKYRLYGNRDEMAPIFTSLGIICNNINKPDEALKYLDSALVISKQTKDYQNECIILLNIGTIHIQSDNIRTGITFFENSFFLAQEIDYLLGLSKSFQKLGDAYEKLNMHDEALLYHKLFIDMRDSLLRIENIEATIKKNLEYAFQKERDLTNLKQHKIDIVTKENEKRKNLILIITFILFCVLIMIIILFYLSQRKKQKSNFILENKNTLINFQLKEIKDSIVYAKRIQAVVLPQDSKVKEHLKDSFVLFLPKAIVSGDFYWIEKSGDNVLFAVADCTGHGVPGAMVSVICNNGLNRSVREHKITDPGKILDMTRDIVVGEFEKSGDDVKDGMDIALCSMNSKELKYAGAYNPLWLVRNGEVFETVADKQPISRFRFQKPFTTHHINLQKGDVIYIFTDGYLDQFGGEHDKKYKTSKFKRFLLSIQDKDMDKQRTMLNEEFNRWKADFEQIDDVCIMGVRV